MAVVHPVAATKFAYSTKYKLTALYQTLFVIGLAREDLVNELVPSSRIRAINKIVVSTHMIVHTTRSCVACSSR